MIRAVVVWFVILLLAIVNGAVREKWLICGLVLLTTWLTIGWMHPRSTGDAIRIGVLDLGRGADRDPAGAAPHCPMEGLVE